MLGLSVGVWVRGAAPHVVAEAELISQHVGARSAEELKRHSGLLEATPAPRGDGT